MDLTQIRAELHRLAAMADGWSRPQDIAPIERDLMLARLRDLYESVAFGPSAECAAPAPQSQAASVAASVSLPETAQVEPVEPKIVAASSAAGVSPVAEPEPTASASSEPVAAPSATKPIAEPATEPTASVAEEPAAMVAEESKSTVRTLFGEDEAQLRHRRKQRVIMSLYDTPIDRVGKSGSEERLRNSEPIDLERFTIGSIDRLLADEPAAETPQTEASAAAEPRTETLPEAVAEAPLEEAEMPETVAEKATETRIDAACGEAPVAVAEEKSSEADEPEPTAVMEEVSAVEPEEVAEAAPAPSTEPIAAPSEAAPEPSESAAAPSEAAPASQEAAQPEDLPAPTDSARPAAETSAPIPVRPSEPAPVLGEVIAPHVQTLAETLAAPQETAADRLRHEPIADLRHAVGINDKFLLIRDLFDGNGALYEITIRRLDEFDNFDDCMIYIAEHFAWNPDTDGAKLLMELLERKFA